MGRYEVARENICILNTVSYAFFCNQDGFNELQIESLPKTWKQVRDLSKKMVTFDRNGFLNRVGYLPNYGNFRTSNVIAWQLGQKFIDKEDNVNFSSSELQRSFSWVKNFIDEIGLDNVLQLMGTFCWGSTVFFRKSSHDDSR